MRRIVTRIGGKIIKDETLTSDESARRDSERKRLEEQRLRTHPPGFDEISGCCDRADQS